LGSKKSKPEKLPSFPEVTEVNPNITYPLSSVENCQKRLGDLLFMLQDYSEALNVYKNALKHYTSDKSWKYYAAASEMLALCIFLLDPSRRELDTHLDNAYAYYSKGNAPYIMTLLTGEGCR
jgi:tetratricopeptide (TPR) repeat protein